MTVLVKAAMATVLLLGTMAPVALANGVSINTDRVQVRMDDNGGVQIRTSANRPVIINADADFQPIQPNFSLTPRPQGVRCSVRSHSSQSQTQRVTPSGDRIYTENYSTTRLCQ
jgi:hypothetical protein